MKSPVNVPSKVAKDIKEALMSPGQNYGKDSYTIDLTGTEGELLARDGIRPIDSLSLRGDLYSRRWVM